MLANNEANENSSNKNQQINNIRTRIHPAEELNSILQTYCIEGQEFSPTAIRTIGTAVAKLADSRMLNTANQDLIWQFLKIQNDSLSNQKFPMNIVEIALKILAEPDMPLKLYNDEWIINIINHFAEYCNEIFQNNEKKTQIHSLFSIFRHLSFVVQQINLSDSSLYKLISLSLPAYFLPSSSPSLQSSSCSLITAIFKKYSSLRNDIIIDIFEAVDKNQGNPKYVPFPNDVRKIVSPLSILFIELCQSISSFPCDTESITQEIIQFIIHNFISRSKSSASMGKIFEKFTEDICALLSHPFYPISKIFLKITFESLFPSISKKDDNTRISIKLICIALKNILICTKRVKSSNSIIFPISIFQSLVGFTEDKINEYLHNPESNISEIENENCALNLNSSFPLNAFEELTAHFIISLYLHQSMKLSEVITTSLPFSITLWSSKKLSQEELDNYLLWWRGMLPSDFNYEWTLETAEQICLYEICKQPMFDHVHLLVHHLLKGLENKNSNVRAKILVGLSGLIEIDPDILYHPILVSQIKDSFKDPSAPIRDSVLQIISKYIFQNEQSSSPYFNVVINCLADTSPMVVKRALGTVGQLSKSSDDECLAKLCYLLSLKLNDESSNVAKAARDALIQVLFEDAKDPTQVLTDVINQTQGRPSWFSKFIKPLYLKHKYTPTIKLMINKSFENLNNSPTIQNCRLVREFCDVFPKLCAPQHETIISIITICADDDSLNILSNALNSILNDITNPNISLFTLLMQSVQQYIYLKPASIIRSLIEVSSRISSDILPTNTVLNQTFDYFTKFIRANLNIARQKEFVETPESTKLVNQLCRALYIIGCICRYHKSLVDRNVNQIWGPIQHYFNAPIPKIRSMVLQSVCDICVRDASQIPKAKELVNHAFKLGPPENVSAVIFLKNLIEEETKIEDTTKIDEIRPTYSANLIHDFMSEITKCFSYKDSLVRTAALEFSNTALRYGAINPPDIIKYIISMLCSKDQSNLAIETLKIVIYHYSNILNNRMKDGIKEAFYYVNEMYGQNFTTLPNDDYVFHIGDLLGILPPPQKALYLNAFTDILKDAFSAKPDPFFINWLIRSICCFPFSYVWEPSTIINNLNKNDFTAYISTAYTDAKAMVYALSKPDAQIPKGAKPPVWYTSILILMAKQWLVKKYHIQIKKLKKYETDKKTPVKVAMIQEISFNNIPIPGKKAELNDVTLNLFARLQSTMRMERSFDFSQEE